VSLNIVLLYVVVISLYSKMGQQRQVLKGFAQYMKLGLMFGSFIFCVSEMLCCRLNATVILASFIKVLLILIMMFFWINIGITDTDTFLAFLKFLVYLQSS